MVRGSNGKSIGAWAFLIGIVLVLILAIFKLQPALQTWAIGILIVVGIIIGLLNVSVKETTSFLLATLALVIVSNMGTDALIQLESIGVVGIGAMLKNAFLYLLILFVPTTIIVALKSVFAIAKS